MKDLITKTVRVDVKSRYATMYKIRYGTKSIYIIKPLTKESKRRNKGFRLRATLPKSRFVARVVLTKHMTKDRPKLE